MIKYIVKHHKPQILVITPLLTGHKVGKDVKKGIKRNKTPFEWITYMGPGNPCYNTQMGLNNYRRIKELPPYIIKIDNDILAQRGMLDVMIDTLKRAPDETAYCYCNFEFRGAVIAKFSADNFDAQRLKHTNYISSCSLIDTKKLINVGGWVTDDKGFRLLDWALWLKFLQRGYIGTPTKTTSFVAMASANSVSAGGSNDYHIKRRWVLENFG